MGAYADGVTWTRLLPAAVAALLVVVYAVGSGRWVATSGSWYSSLTQPAWQPPPAVFGLAWTYNFLILGIVGVLVALRAPLPRTITYLIVFAVSIACALAWAYLFYGPHQLVAAAAFLTACAVVTIGLVVLAWGQEWWLGVLLLPYLLWLAIASSLSWGYVHLN